MAANSTTAPPDPSEPPKKPTIFVSYAWDKKTDEDVRGLAKFLQVSGLFEQVWIDVDFMENGPIGEQMAKNVKKADVVLVCFNNYYQTRDNCETEAKLAKKNKKQMVFVNMEKDEQLQLEDWFDAVILDNLYIDFYRTERPHAKVMQAVQIKLGLVASPRNSSLVSKGSGVKLAATRQDTLKSAEDAMNERRLSLDSEIKAELDLLSTEVAELKSSNLTCNHPPPFKKFMLAAKASKIGLHLQTLKNKKDTADKVSTLESQLKASEAKLDLLYKEIEQIKQSSGQATTEPEEAIVNF